MLSRVIAIVLVSQFACIEGGQPGALTADGTPSDTAEPEGALCDGIDDAVLVKLESALQASELTVELYVRATDPNEAVSTEYILAANTSSPSDHLWLALDDAPAGHTLVAMVRGGAGGCQSSSTGVAWEQTFERAAWHHIAVTFEKMADGRVTLALYLDGQPRLSGPHSWLQGAETCLSPRVISLCRTLDPFRQALPRFAGAVDDVRISSGVRYREAFEPPAALEADDDTLVFLDLDSASPVFEGSLLGHVEFEGNPALISHDRFANE